MDELKNIKAKGIEKIPFESKLKKDRLIMKNSLTIKSIIVAVVTFLARFILQNFFPDEMVEEIIQIIIKVLDMSGIVASGVAMYGLRRAINKIESKML